MIFSPVYVSRFSLRNRVCFVIPAFGSGFILAVATAISDNDLDYGRGFLCFPGLFKRDVSWNLQQVCVCHGFHQLHSYLSARTKNVYHVMEVLTRSLTQLYAKAILFCSLLVSVVSPVSKGWRSNQHLGIIQLSLYAFVSNR